MGDAVSVSPYQGCSEITSELLKGFLLVLGKEILNSHHFTSKASWGTGTITVSSFKWKEKPQPPRKAHGTV